MSKFEIVLKPEAINDLNSIKKYFAAKIAECIEKFLSYNPMKISKSRIKRLLGKQKSDYRLRVGEYRVFYNVNTENMTVYILKILHKKETKKFYKEPKS